MGQQFGGIRGQVVDSDFGQPIGKASVAIMDTPFGAMTDDQGNFTISGVSPGIYSLQVRASGYIPKTMPQVAVSAGSFNEIRFESVAEIEELEELVVPGEIEKTSETGLLAERQQATALMDMMGQDLISRLGASTAGDALRRMVGASVVDGKYVVVRGMPDRYVNTLLNGGRLPSSDGINQKIGIKSGLGIVLHCGAHPKRGFVWKLAGPYIHAASGEIARLVRGEGLVDVEAFDGAGRE